MSSVPFRSERRGAVLILFTLILPVMIGLMALVIDISITLYRKNEAQRVADVAAMSAIRAATSSSMYGSEGATIDAGKYEAYEVAKLNGFPDACSAVSDAPPYVTVNSPPALATSNYYNQSGAFEVTIKIPQTRI